MNTDPLGYCGWCGAEIAPESQLGGFTGFFCGRCKRKTGAPFPEDTLQICSSCKGAFLATVYYCPGCGTVSATAPPGVLPFPPMKADWPTSWRGHERGLIAPPCPACGKKLRPDGAGWCDYSSTAMPWNHGWDGRCASCGHEVAVSVIGGHDGDRPQFHLKRVVTMRPEVSVHFIGLDLQKHYSGVRIRVEDSGEKVSEVFLSMGELKSLVRSLDDKANPLLRQIDYLVDVT